MPSTNGSAEWSMIGNRLRFFIGLVLVNAILSALALLNTQRILDTSRIMVAECTPLADMLHRDSLALTEKQLAMEALHRDVTAMFAKQKALGLQVKMLTAARDERLAWRVETKKQQVAFMLAIAQLKQEIPCVVPPPVAETPSWWQRVWPWH